MIGRDYTYTFASGVAAPVRPWRHFRAALVALAAVCVFGVSLVTREEVTTPSVRARNAVVMPTPTPIWQLEARWWAGDNRQASVLLAAISSKTELTFANGYQARLAARQATTTVAAAPSTEIHPSDANKAVTVADTVPLPTPRPPRRVAVARTEPPAPTRFDYQTQATLAFRDQRQTPRAFFAQPNNPFSGLFGTGNLY